MGQVQLFNFKGADVRLVEIEGQPWFVAADVRRALDYSLMKNGQPNVTAVTKHLDDNERSFNQVKTLGSTSRVRIISESGLYKLVMRSDKKEAKVVLPITLARQQTAPVVPLFGTVKVERKSYSCLYHPGDILEDYLGNGCPLISIQRFSISGPNPSHDPKSHALLKSGNT